MKQIIKIIPGARKTYNWANAFAKAYLPTIRAKIAYRVAYGKRCDLKNPSTFCEKLLWLSLNTYRNNMQVLNLCDKYLVRSYVEKKIGKEYLNELYAVYDNLNQIQYDNLPNSFVLKVSQGCTTNIFCKDKSIYNRNLFEETVKGWAKNQKLYDKMMADIGGVRIKDYKKYYVCEKYLCEEGKSSPTDYKFYCFHGEPKAVLVVSDRFGDETGLFLTPEWEILQEQTGAFRKPEVLYAKPQSLQEMLVVARVLSAGFPFVRVDLYDINGKVIFGEMTFFPNGCIRPVEAEIEGKPMGELLDITEYIKRKG